MARQAHFFSVCTAGLLFMFCVHQTNGWDCLHSKKYKSTGLYCELRTKAKFFSSVQFTRDSLMQFSRGSERRVNITVNISAGVSSPSNKFFKVLNDIERSVANANARGISYSAATVSRLEHLLEKAVDTKNYKYARQVLGQIMYMLSIKPASKRRRKRRDLGTEFIEGLQKKLGSDSFDRFMAVHNTASLVFVVDDTGSMGNEIEAVKSIAIDIINYTRQNSIIDMYVLSPFNDPYREDDDVVKIRDKGEGNLFVEDINALRAGGGGDCPENTFKGILKALDSGPTEGSPMYVFTDADPKDATSKNIAEVLFLAGDEEQDMTINFLLTGHCGGRVHPAFDQVAKNTSGLVIAVKKNDMEMKNLSSLIGGELSGFAITDHGKSGSLPTGRRKRRNADSRYRILVDDTMKKISVTVSTTRPDTYGEGITLKDPDDSVIESEKLSLSQICVYQIDNPKKGTWILTVAGENGEHEYYVKSSSATNVEFNHYFLTTLPGRRRLQSVDVPVSDPLMGQRNILLVTLAGLEKVERGSLRIRLITTEGGPISDHTLQQTDTGHFMTSIIPLSRQEFNLKLLGNTVSGSPFQRMSRQTIQPCAALLRSRSATNDYTLPLHRTTFIHFQLCNFGNTERFDVPVAKDKMRYLTTRRVSSKRVLKNRCVIIALRAMATRLEDVNKTDTVFVTAKGRSTGTLVSATGQFFVVSGVER